MALFISVVNHNHDEIICSNSTLKSLAKEHTVILKSNTPATIKLQTYCNNNSIILIQGKKKKGFGANNNETFNFAIENLNMSNRDYFLVLNPDIYIDNSSINELINKKKHNNTRISTINLYIDDKREIYDYSIRKFPSIVNPIKSLLKIPRKDWYDKNRINTPTIVEWAAGSFLMFEVSAYQDLNGFNEKYFMYYEDVDICKRAQKKGIFVVYFPSISAVHKAAFKNRKIFSISNFYYIKSFFRYFFNNK